jgi:gamma-tubulin complex component 2
VQSVTSERLVQLDRALTKVENSWAYHVRLMIDSLKLFSSTEASQFLVLMNRLDFNGFYAGDHKEGVYNNI